MPSDCCAKYNIIITVWGLVTIVLVLFYRLILSSLLLVIVTVIVVVAAVFVAICIVLWV